MAVDIDERTRTQVAGISTAVRGSIDPRIRASWVSPERMHLTLCFFGAADAALEQRIAGALVEPVREAPFDLSFGGLGFFPERGAPRVIWLGVRRGADQLQRVQQILHARFRIAAGREAFSPHLTLARVKERTARARFEKTAEIAASAGPSRIDRVTLYDSRLLPGGPRYVPIAEAPLQP